MKKHSIIMAITTAVVLTACGNTEFKSSEIASELEETSEIATNTTEKETEAQMTDENLEMEQDIFIPSKDEVLAARDIVLEGMTQDQIERLSENIKVANLTFENAYLNQNIFEELEDENSLYWNYFDQKGEIQIGWTYDGDYSEIKKIMDMENLSREEFDKKYGEPVIEYNRFDAQNFIELIKDIQNSVNNEQLHDDLQYLIDETQLAADTHEMEYANNIYKLLHDMDYYLLRYGPEDVGIYASDDSLINRYYGTLSIYR